MEKPSEDMETHELYFGEITIIQHDIVELVVNEGQEVSKKELNVLNDFLLKNMPAKFSLLVNKINQYSYTLDAQQHLFDLEAFQAIAIIVHSKISKISNVSVMAIPKKKVTEAQVFDNREDGLAWLKKLQKASHNLPSISQATK